MSMLVAIGALSVTAGGLADRPTDGTGTPAAVAGTGTVAAPTTVATRSGETAPRVSGTDLVSTRRGLDALAAIPYDWVSQLPGWEIRFHAATSGAYGYTRAHDQRIDIYVRPDEPDDLLAHVVAHELGHAVDVTYNDGDDRQRWIDLRGFADGVPWWPDNRAADFATGAGDFAESFAAWQVGEAGFRSQLGEPPSAEARALLVELSIS